MNISFLKYFLSIIWRGSSQLPTRPRDPAGDRSVWPEQWSLDSAAWSRGRIAAAGPGLRRMQLLVLTWLDQTDSVSVSSVSPHYLHFARNFRRPGRASELNISESSCQCDIMTVMNKVLHISYWIIIRVLHLFTNMFPVLSSIQFPGNRVMTVIYNLSHISPRYSVGLFGWKWNTFWK